MRIEDTTPLSNHNASIQLLLNVCATCRLSWSLEVAQIRRVSKWGYTDLKNIFCATSLTSKPHIYFHSLKPKETPQNFRLVQRSLGPRKNRQRKIFGHDQELDPMINLKPARGTHGKNLDGRNGLWSWGLGVS